MMFPVRGIKAAGPVWPRPGATILGNSLIGDRQYLQPHNRAHEDGGKRDKREQLAQSGTLTMNVFTFTTPVMQPVIAVFEKLTRASTIQAANVVNTPST